MAEVRSRRRPEIVQAQSASCWSCPPSESFGVDRYAVRLVNPTLRQLPSPSPCTLASRANLISVARAREGLCISASPSHSTVILVSTANNINCTPRCGSRQLIRCYVLTMAPGAVNRGPEDEMRVDKRAESKDSTAAPNSSADLVYGGSLDTSPLSCRQ